MDMQDTPSAAVVGRPRGHRTGMERFLIGLTALLLLSSVVLVASLVYVVTSGEEEVKGGREVDRSVQVVAEGNRTQGGMASPRTMGQATVPEQFQGDLCVTPGCVSVASHLLRARDETVSPCEDFFRHACGGWQRRASQLGLADADSDYSVNIDQPQAVIDWTLTQLLSSPKQEDVEGFQKTKRFFNLCKEHLPARRSVLELAADHMLEHVLGGFRSWSRWSAAGPVPLTQLLVQLHRLQAGPLFQLHRAVDPRDHSRRVVVVTLPDGDPMEHAPERRHRPAAGVRRSPWIPHQATKPLRRRRRVKSASTGSESGTHDAAGHERTTHAYTSARFFSAIKKAVAFEHINESMEFFGMNIAKSNDSDFYTDDGMIADWHDMQQFLYNFSKIMPTHRERAEMEINSQLQCQYSVTVDQLGAELLSVNWTRLLREAISPDITGKDEVCLPFPQYMEDLDLMLTMFSPRIVHNAVLLMYRKTHLNHLVLALSGAQKSDQAAAQYCLGLVQNFFPVPLAGMFVRDAGRSRVDALKVKVSSLVSEVRDELVRAIEKRNTQTPSPIYGTALEKLRRLRSFIGASESYWEDRFINSHAPDILERLFDQESDQHRLLRLIETMAAVGETFSDQYLDSDQQAEETIWNYVVQPYSPNAFYLPDRNAVVIPLAFLSEPYLYDDVPRYITLAALGTTVAHELLHSIGVTGFYFNGAGELHDLSDAEEHQLSELRHCVRHQFTRNLSREVEISGLQFSAQPNGELTLDENLSDHDGLALAWRTYHRWQHQHRHSPEPRLPGVQGSVRQTFLLVLAQTYCAKVAPLSYVTSAEVDTHLPNPERINAMVRHFPGFASAFGCPAGSPMRPEHQCNPIWLPL